MDVSVKFVDFWPSFDSHNNKFVRALEGKHRVSVIDSASEAVPDILIYSYFGMEHLKYNCVKVYFTGENDVPNFNECDYALSFRHIDFGGRHMRYPLYMFYEYDEAMNPPSVGDSQALGREFCSVVMRNTENCHPTRLKIVDAFEAYKPLAYGGPWRNNVGGPVAEKIPFIANYKFNLALENSRIDGYVTEKIVEPCAAATVPIYWGAPDVVKDINPASFVNAADYDTLDSLVNAVRELDTSPQEYLKMLRAPIFLSDLPADFDSRLSEFLCGIVDGGLHKCVPSHGEAANLHRRDSLLLPLSQSRVKMKILKLFNKLSNGI